MNKDFLKEFATAFFYKWYNSPGTNTQQGFDSWYDTEDAQRILRKHGINTDVMRSLPPLDEIEQVLNLAQCELRSMYRKVGIKGSNILDDIDRTWETVKAAMPS